MTITALGPAVYGVAVPLAGMVRSDHLAEDLRDALLALLALCGTPALIGLAHVSSG